LLGFLSNNQCLYEVLSNFHYGVDLFKNFSIMSRYPKKMVLGKGRFSGVQKNKQP